MKEGKTLTAMTQVHGLATTPGQGAQGYIRVPWNNDPVKDITSPSLTCNTNNTEAPVYVAVNGGDKLTMQWHHDSVSASDDIIDATHVGPIITYMAPSGTGAGTVWVKIAQSGYDNSAKKWAVTTLIANKGKSDITVPSALAPGKYLVRQEIIALHEADTAYSSNPKRGAQLYISCVQITIGTGGSTVSSSFLSQREIIPISSLTYRIESSSRCSHTWRL